MNRSQWAVVRHCRALATAHFELGIREPDGSMIPRIWTGEEVFQAVAWLRFKNSNGCDIYIRPAGQLGLILLDDLEENALQALARDGFPPAAVIQTSPANFQAWIRLVTNRKGRPLPTSLLTAAAVNLADRYNADPDSADWRHLGRLGGFTNRKPCHRRDELFPFVLVCEATGISAPRGRELLRDLLRRRQADPALAKPVLPPLPTQNLTYSQRAERLLYANRHQPWACRPDPSRMDFMIARDLYREGYPPEQILRHLADSPHLATRKRGHVADYLQRTVIALTKG